MAMRKVTAFGNVGDDFLPGCHLTVTHCVQCVAGPRARKWFSAQLHLGKRKGLLMWFLFCLPVFSFVGIFLCLVL